MDRRPFQVILTKAALKDVHKLKSARLEDKAIEIRDILSFNPYSPKYEKLNGLNNCYSRRINIQHRLVYEVDNKNKIVKVLRMWTHYEYRIGQYDPI